MKSSLVRSSVALAACVAATVLTLAASPGRDGSGIFAIKILSASS